MAAAGGRRPRQGLASVAVLAALVPAVPRWQPWDPVVMTSGVHRYGLEWAERLETQKGTISPGMLADIAVLSQDIFTVKPDALPATVSVLTLVGGKIVHEERR